MRLSWNSQRNDYRGVINFAQVTDSVSSTVHAACSIPLFLRDVPVPIRKPKITEQIAQGTIAGSSVYDTSSAVALYGIPEPLTVSISGWTITPVLNGIWRPTTDGRSAGTSLNLSNHSYPDIITAYLEGRMKRDATGRGRRVDPYEYVDPYGNVYVQPKIMSFDFQYTATTKKVMINMTLWLENNANSGR